MKKYVNDLGIDLGTSNVRIYAADQGIVIREPAVVAVDKNSGKVLQVGAAARNMLGRTPGNVVAMYPMKDSVISDLSMTVKMLEHQIQKASPKSIFAPKPRVVLCVPSGVTEVEERTFINAAIEAGARRVYLIQAPLAAALGAELNIDGPGGHMIVDIGGGTTDIAVLTMNGVATASSIEIAGNAFDEVIGRYVRREYGVAIGQATAEDIKIEIGCVHLRSEDASMVVRGRDIKTGTPRELTLTSSEICEVLRRPARMIADEILAVLEDTSPELVGDIAENGITLTGGSSQLWGIAQLLQERTGIPCSIADNTDSCVALGCGKSLNWITKMNEGPINVARKRLLGG